jgi:hypothetical protein
MNWEPVENAKSVLEAGEIVLCWIVTLDRFNQDKDETFDVFEYTGNGFLLYGKISSKYRITHFMVIDEP